MSKQNNRDLLWKWVIIGNSGVGKTSILSRLCNDEFSNTFISTIGIDFKIKKMQVGNKNITVQIWDTAGQERFGTITKSCYRGCNAVLLVYDVCSRKTFEDISKWLNEIHLHAGDSVCKLLLGNKCDLDGSRSISLEEAKELADKLDVPFMEVSAKTSKNIQRAFATLVELILGESITELSSPESDKSKTSLSSSSIKSPVGGPSQNDESALSGGKWWSFGLKKSQTQEGATTSGGNDLSKKGAKATQPPTKSSQGTSPNSLSNPNPPSPVPRKAITKPKVSPVPVTTFDLPKDNSKASGTGNRVIDHSSLSEELAEASMHESKTEPSQAADSKTAAGETSSSIGAQAHGKGVEGPQGTKADVASPGGTTRKKILAPSNNDLGGDFTQVRSERYVLSRPSDPDIIKLSGLRDYARNGGRSSIAENGENGSSLTFFEDPEQKSKCSC